MHSSTLLLLRMVRVIVSLLPWAAVLYLHYYLERQGVWEVDMPLRALLSVILLAIGMFLSFVLHSFLTSKERLFLAKALSRAKR